MNIDRKEKLVDAFEHMIDNVAEAVQEAEEALEPTIDEMVRNAEVLTREVYSLTVEEAENLADTLKRDIHRANEVMNRQGKELRDWLSFDLELVEDRFADLIARAADKTWLAFREFEQAEPHPDTYHSGEICTAGTFGCTACERRVHLRRSGRLPPCPSCHHGEYTRVVG